MDQVADLLTLWITAKGHLKVEVWSPGEDTGMIFRFRNHLQSETTW